MSVESISRVLNYVDPRVMPTAKLVLVGIANHDGDGGAWPSIATLARYVGIEERGVQKHIAALVEMGRLRVDAQKGGTVETRNDRRTNRYTLLFPAVDNSDDGVSHKTPRESDGVSTSAERGVHQRADGVSPRTPEPSYEPSLEPSSLTTDDATTAIVEEVVRRVVAHREELGYGPAGAGAIAAVRKEVDRAMARRWLDERHTPAEIARCLASRITEPDAHSTPTVYWQPPEREPEPTPEQVTEILREAGVR